MAVETLDYEVIKKEKNIEIRQYPAYLQAEADVEGINYRDAAQKGFSILADYIFGNNIAREKIDMTTPVRASRPEKIAMTSPVKVEGSGTYTISFVMPSKYNIDTLPVPKNKNVRIRQVGAAKIAAIRFSGYFNQDTISRNKEILNSFLEKENLETLGDFIIAGYNPPWIPGFLSRNEIMAVLADSMEKQYQK
jgi:hypothetical protein